MALLNPDKRSKNKNLFIKLKIRSLYNLLPLYYLSNYPGLEMNEPNNPINLSTIM